MEMNHEDAKNTKGGGIFPKIFERMGVVGSFFPYAKIQTNTGETGAGEGACGGEVEAVAGGA